MEGDCADFSSGPAGRVFDALLMTSLIAHQIVIVLTAINEIFKWYALH